MAEDVERTHVIRISVPKAACPRWWRPFKRARWERDYYDVSDPERYDIYEDWWENAGPMVPVAAVAAVEHLKDTDG